MGKLPDHSNIYGSGSGPLFRDKIDEFRSRFEFEASFPLREQLEECASEYLAYRNMPKGPVSEQKQLLKALTERTELLIDVLGKLGLQGEWDVMEHMVNRYKKPQLSRSELEEQLRDWNLASTKALSELKINTGKGGRPTNTLERGLILGLHAIYQNGTGRDDRITKISDQPDQHYGGRFFDFVDSVLTAIGCPKQNAQLGKAIEQSLKRIPKTTSK